MGKIQNIVMVACAVLGAFIGVAILYFTMVPLFGWWPIPSKPAPEAPVIPEFIAPSVLLFFGILGVALLATAWVMRFRKPKSEGKKVEFYPDRAKLQRAEGTLAERFASVSTISALWVIGQKFYMAGTKTDAVKRLLLPKPDSESFKHFVKTSPHASAGSMVREVTELALAAGTKVRWYETFVFHSIILADVDKPTGWMHIESVFPYSRPEYRPSYTLYKKHSPDAIAEMQRVFDELWEKAKAPSSTISQSSDDRIPLHEAAVSLYEEAEREGVLDIVAAPHLDVDVKLNLFKRVFMVDSEVILWGVQPPSTQTHPIPRDKYRQELHPVSGQSSLAYITPNKVAYINVTVRQGDLDRIKREFPIQARQQRR